MAEVFYHYRVALFQNLPGEPPFAAAVRTIATSPTNAARRVLGEDLSPVGTADSVRAKVTRAGSNGEEIIVLLYRPKRFT